MPTSDEVKCLYNDAALSHGSVLTNPKHGFKEPVDIADLASDFGCRIIHIKVVIASLYLRTLSTLVLTTCAFHLSKDAPLAWGVSVLSAAVGSLVSGVHADGAGRRHVLQCGVHIQLSLAVAMLLFSPHTGSSINAIFLVLLGLAAGALTMLPMPLMVELLPPSMTVFAAAVMEIGQVLGYSLALWLAPPCEAWLPVVLAGLCAFGSVAAWCIPESPRWLLVRHRVADCRSTLKRLFESRSLCQPPAHAHYTSCPPGLKVAPRIASMGGQLARATGDASRHAFVGCTFLSMAVGIATSVGDLPRVPFARCGWGAEMGYQRLGALPLPAGLELTSTGLAFMAVAIALFAGSTKRKTILAAGLLCTSVCTILLGLLRNGDPAFIAVCCVVVTVTHILRVIFMAYVVELFPTNTRAAAVGVSGCASLVGPVVLTHGILCLYRWGGKHPSAAIALPAFALVCGLAILPFMDEVKQHTLQDV